MSVNDLTTPIYLKMTAGMPWPNDAVFYLLTRDGLFLCRNHPFFRSSVPARRSPRELSWHDTSLKVSYPRIPRAVLAQVIAFFACVGVKHNAEAIVLLAWDREFERVRIVVPDQVATVGRNCWNETWPIGVEYQTPTEIPMSWTFYGDIHSHVDGPAVASQVDHYDELHSPGVHLIVGRVFDEEPDFVAQAVVDGTRFNLQLSHVMEPFAESSPRFPQSWLKRVKIELPGEEPFPIVEE